MVLKSNFKEKQVFFMIVFPEIRHLFQKKINIVSEKNLTRYLRAVFKGLTIIQK